MTTTIESGADILDVRDIIERFEELRTELQDAHEGQGNDDTFAEWVVSMAQDEGGTLQEAAQEYVQLEGLLINLRGNGGDEQWRGDWYPVTLIHDSYFEESMDEMLEDYGTIPKYADLPSFVKIVIDYDALKQDYSEVEFEGETYYYR